MKAYLDLLRKIMDEGTVVQTGAYLPGEKRQPTARRLHGEQLRFDLSAGFPAVTTKPLWWRAVVAEWLWFMRGEGTIDFLRQERVSSIWESWVKKEKVPHVHRPATCYDDPGPGHGPPTLVCAREFDEVDTADLGPVYGVQFRRMQGVRWQERPLVQPHVDYETLLRDGKRLQSGGTGLATGDVAFDEVAYAGYRYMILGQGGKFRAVQQLGPHHDVVEVDQISNAVNDIRAVVANPFDRARRRIIVSLWNPAQVPAMQLPPCHTFHFYDLEPPPPVPYVTGRERPDELEAYADRRWTLNLHLCARSIDAVKGLPFNIASYALMLEAMARVTNTKPGTLTITFNDVHIYDNQFDEVREQLAREPYLLPRFGIDPGRAKMGGYTFERVCPDLAVEQVRRLSPEMFYLDGYKHHGKLAASSEVAV